MAGEHHAGRDTFAAVRAEDAGPRDDGVDADADAVAVRAPAEPDGALLMGGHGASPSSCCCCGGRWFWTQAR